MACGRARRPNPFCGKVKKRKRSRRRSKKKSCRPGKVTRNPFFNYLRWFRKKHCGMTAVQVAVEGAKCWCRMSDEQRKQFYKEACSAPKMRRRKKSRSRSRSRRSRRGHGGCGGRSRRRRSRSRRKHRSRSRSRSRKRSRSSCGSRASRSSCGTC